MRATLIPTPELTELELAAINGAASPGPSNVFATMADVGGTDVSVDGGAASTTYLPTQLIDGGAA
jgi:hypothetical protein